MASTQQAARPGRPRSERARTAILGAASEMLLEQGLNEISMDAVAERAGTSKATIYRWWPSKELLALDALLGGWEPQRPSHTASGTVTENLIALLEPWTRELAAKPYGRVIAAFVNRVQGDAQFAAAYRARFVQPRRDSARAILAHAIGEGEISADTDIETAVDMLYGPIYHRLLHGHAPLSDQFARTVVHHVVAGLGGAE